MTVVTQLAEFIAVETPLGDGYAVLVETGGDDQLWTVIISNSRAFVTFPQNKLRAKRSYTHGRDLNDAQMLEILEGVGQPKPGDVSFCMHCLEHGRCAVHPNGFSQFQPVRSCTCHPSERPHDCPGKHSLSDCWEARGARRNG